MCSYEKKEEFSEDEKRYREMKLGFKNKGGEKTDREKKKKFICCDHPPRLEFDLGHARNWGRKRKRKNTEKRTRKQFFFRGVKQTLSDCGVIRVEISILKTLNNKH